MKDKVLVFIIGILIGAIVTAGCFLIFYKKDIPSNSTNVNRPEMESFEPGNKLDRKMQQNERKNKRNRTENNKTENNLT